MNSKLYFDSVKEKYDTFFVEYRPPLNGFLFATLRITYLGDVRADAVISDLEKHAMKWVQKYPVSLMAWALDEHGRMIDLRNENGQKYLTALKNGGSFDIHWDPLPDSAFPTETLDADYLLSVYSDIGHRTQDEVTESAFESIKPMRRLKIIILIWAVFVPAFIAVLEFFSPTWIAVIALLYSFWKAYQEYLLMTGRKEKSDAKIAKEKEELRMRHHHYHCEKNPEGFIRLRNENFKADAKERIKNEFESLPEHN